MHWLGSRVLNTPTSGTNHVSIFILKNHSSWTHIELYKMYTSSVKVFKSQQMLHKVWPSIRHWIGSWGILTPEPMIGFLRKFPLSKTEQTSHRFVQNIYTDFRFKSNKIDSWTLKIKREVVYKFDFQELAKRTPCCCGVTKTENLNLFSTSLRSRCRHPKIIYQGMLTTVEPWRRAEYTVGNVFRTITWYPHVYYYL